jgi:hypothetical protein
MNQCGIVFPAIEFDSGQQTAADGDQGWPDLGAGLQAGFVAHAGGILRSFVTL